MRGERPVEEEREGRIRRGEGVERERGKERT